MKQIEIPGYSPGGELTPYYQAVINNGVYLGGLAHSGGEEEIKGGGVTLAKFVLAGTALVPSAALLLGSVHSAYAGAVSEFSPAQDDITPPSVAIIGDSIGVGMQGAGEVVRKFAEAGIEAHIDAQGSRPLVWDFCDTNPEGKSCQNQLDGPRALERSNAYIVRADVVNIRLGTNNSEGFYDDLLRVGRDAYGRSMADGEPALIVYAKLWGSPKFQPLAIERNALIEQAVAQLELETDQALGQAPSDETHFMVLAEPFNVQMGDSVHPSKLGYGQLTDLVRDQLTPLVYEQHAKLYGTALPVVPPPLIVSTPVTPEPIQPEMVPTAPLAPITYAEPTTSLLISYNPSTVSTNPLPISERVPRYELPDLTPNLLVNYNAALSSRGLDESLGLPVITPVSEPVALRVEPDSNVTSEPIANPYLQSLPPIETIIAPDVPLQPIELPEPVLSTVPTPAVEPTSESVTPPSTTIEPTTDPTLPPTSDPVPADPTTEPGENPEDLVVIPPITMPTPLIVSSLPSIVVSDILPRLSEIIEPEDKDKNKSRDDKESEVVIPSDVLPPADRDKRDKDTSSAGEIPVVDPAPVVPPATEPTDPAEPVVEPVPPEEPPVVPITPPVTNPEGLRGDTIPEKIFNFYMDKHTYTYAGVLGIMANMKAESGLQPARPQNSWNGTCAVPPERLEPGTKDDRGPTRGYGFGLIQNTTQGLQEALQGAADERGMSWMDLYTQLDLLDRQIQGGGFGDKVKEILTTSDDAGVTTVAVLGHIERPQAWIDGGKAREGVISDRIGVAAELDRAISSGEVDYIPVGCSTEYAALGLNQ